MKSLAYVLMAIGLVGIIYFGFQAISNSETFSFLGLDIAVSSANWTPVFVSAIVAVLGFTITPREKREK